MRLISLPGCLQSVHKWSYYHPRHLDMNCSDSCEVQQERALLAGILLVDSCLCETEKVRHIDSEERCLLSREGLATMQIIIFYWGQSGVQVMFEIGRASCRERV